MEVHGLMVSLLHSLQQDSGFDSWTSSFNVAPDHSVGKK